MERPKGGTLLWVSGIIMIVGGAISIIASLVLILAVIGLISVGGPVVVIIGIIITILASIAELIAGIICTKNSYKPAAASKCMAWAIIVIVLMLIGTIMTNAGIDASMGVNSTFSTVVSIVLGMVVPILAVIGAVILKKNAGGDVSLSGLAKDTAAEFKNMDDDVAGIAAEAKEKTETAAAEAKEKTEAFAAEAKEKAGDIAAEAKETKESIAAEAKEKVEDIKDKFKGENE